MSVNITGTNVQGSTKRIELNRIPDTCPICHRSVHPKLIVSTFIRGGVVAQTIFQCTSLECEEYFIATYDLSNIINANSSMYSLVRVSPTTAKESEFPEAVREISPTFVEIYNQSMAAESKNLTQLVGIGLRKALEFLVKDFAISQSPSDVDKIKALPLAQCINNYLSDPNLKSCAKRAVWLGNDETHYTRKWEEKDIKDLKVLVKLTINWAENVLLTAQYEEEMDN